MPSPLRFVLVGFLVVILWGGIAVSPPAIGQSTGPAPSAALPQVPLPRVDLSGLDAFWAVADMLSSERPVADATWEMLFATPGYRMLWERYPLRYPIVEAMKLTFDPQRAAERETVEASSVWMRPRMIRHFRRVRDQRVTLRSYRQQLAADDSLMHDAMGLLRPHLPASALSDRYPPIVAFVLFLDDGYASPNVVAIDLWMAHTMGREALTRFVAHELFHAYRSSITRPRTDRDNGYVTMLVGALEQLENEGIADRIDKPALLTQIQNEPRHPTDGPESSTAPPDLLTQYTSDYRAAYADAPETIQTIDRELSLLEERQKLSPGTVRKIQRAIPMGGHPTGAFMADVIADVRGEKVLRATVGDVFAFLHAYHHAATDHPVAPPFSDAALDMLERLDRWTDGE